MQLTFLDWSVVALYFLFNIAIGYYYKARAGRNLSEFFLSGRDVPWWLSGTSMVATTFAADTPLAVTGMVARWGIAGNWLWWCFVASGMMTVFLCNCSRPGFWGSSFSIPADFSGQVSRNRLT